MKKLVDWVEKSDFSRITTIPVFISVGLFILYGLLPDGFSSTKLGGVILFLIFFLAGISFFFIALQRKIPTMLFVPKSVAVIYGILLSGICWGFALLVVYRWFLTIFYVPPQP